MKKEVLIMANKNFKDSSRKGDLAEYYAVTWLWDNGYEVFKNTGCTGLVDMIAMKEGMTTFIDVKTMTKDKSTNYRGKSGRTDEQKKLNVQFLLFHPETRNLRWSKHRT
ncbi:hypothetical protein N9S40_00020 [Candidatus Pelagibacter sp.]|nr:hypothetical protein [Candidatus Pelagibacter sp.]